MRRLAMGLCLLALACSSTAPSPGPASLLYVQTASSGSFEPLPGTNKYRLGLSALSPRVIYFTDRPNRIAGQGSTPEFPDTIGSRGPPDPNPAIEIADGHADTAR